MWALLEGKEAMFNGRKACANTSEVEDNGREERKGRTIKEEEEEGG